jgi:hypothetical protein
MTEIRPGDPLANLAGARQRTAPKVEPQVVAKTDGVDDERVAVPTAEDNWRPMASRRCGRPTAPASRSLLAQVSMCTCARAVNRRASNRSSETSR